MNWLSVLDKEVAKLTRLQFFRPSLEMLNLIGKIDEFKGSWSLLSNIAPERLNALKHVATIESIGSSTRIEGALMSDGEVESLLSGLSTSSFRTRDEQEVAGYAGVMQLIFESAQHMPVSENVLKQLHRDLLKYSTKDEHHRGEYKTITNHVEATLPDGTKRVVFQTASPFDTLLKMPELIAWADERLSAGDVHPLLVTAVFIAEFLAIHPFTDGNGRLSRVLTTFFLLKARYDFVPYSSLESVVESNKERYYLALRNTQKTLSDESPDWDPWILFFLQSMKKQIQKLDEKIARERIFVGNIPSLSIRILEFVREKGSTQMSDLEDALGESRSTIKVRVQELVETGQLERHGKARATWYTLRSPKALDQSK